MHIITGLSDGGAEAVLYRLCCATTENQPIVVSLTDDGKYGRLLRQIGISVYTLNMSRWKLPFFGVLQLWRVLRRECPDLVQTWMYHADLIGGVTARLAGIRHVCWGVRHSNLIPGKSKLSTIRVANLCAHLSTIIPTCIVFCAYRSVLVHQALGYNQSNCVVIPNGYDISLFRPMPDEGYRLRQSLNLSPMVRLIGMVGRYDPQKDHACLIGALARLATSLPDLVCLFVGTGMDAENVLLNKLIESAGLNGHIHLLGRRDDIPSIMNALDLHVLSSSFGEAFPNVLAEAMACGTPCLTTDVGDAALIVGDTGWVVPPGDPEALAGAITHALSERADSVHWAARQAAARERIVNHYSLETLVRRYEEVWRCCLQVQ